MKTALLLGLTLALAATPIAAMYQPSGVTILPGNGQVARQQTQVPTVIVLPPGIRPTLPQVPRCYCPCVCTCVCCCPY